MLREIMELRKDPTASAVMGAAFANENAKTLTERLGRKPTDGELYIAHFLGASGAVRLISAAQTQPNTPRRRPVPEGRRREHPGLLRRKHRRGAQRLGRLQVSGRRSTTVPPRGSRRRTGAVVPGETPRARPSVAIPAAPVHGDARAGAGRAAAGDGHRQHDGPGHSASVRRRSPRRSRSARSGPIFHGSTTTATAARSRRWCASCGACAHGMPTRDR